MGKESATEIGGTCHREQTSCDGGGCVRLKAPAKINLTLHILSKRSDGYHELVTRMQKLELSDDITLLKTHRPGVSLKCLGNEVPTGQTNLAWRAADVFFQETSRGQGEGVDILLTKNIPVAAGLGGGSSDAGSVLRGLDRLFETKLPEKSLVGMAKRLGADVPFFVTPYGAVVAKGIGDRMTAVDSLAAYRIILVNPGFSVSTAWAYENYSLTKENKTFKKKGLQGTMKGSFLLQDMYNDLESVTVDRYPVIDEVKRAMMALGAEGAMMSGSGPTIFGVFPESIVNRSLNFGMIKNTLESEFQGKVFVTKAVGRLKDC